MAFQKLIKFQVMCEQRGIEVPEVVSQARGVIEAVKVFGDVPRRPVLDMSAAEMREYVLELSVERHSDGRGSTQGFRPGVLAVQDQVWAEVREQIVPDLDRIVEGMQAEFDEVMAPIVAGVKEHGFTYATTSDELVKVGDLNALKAWKAVGETWPKIHPLALFRTGISELFDVSPTQGEGRAFGYLGGDEARNWSVCFAAGDNWSLRDGYHLEDRPSIGRLDWFALAEGGLRLNTPSEVRHKVVARSLEDQSVVGFDYGSGEGHGGESDDSGLLPVNVHNLTYPARK